MFLPVALASLRQTATDSSAVYRALDEKRVHNAVIFADTIVSEFDHTWAFYPLMSGPRLDREDRIFVLWPANDETREEFLQKYPDRQVWGVRPGNKRGPSVWRLR